MGSIREKNDSDDDDEEITIEQCSSLFQEPVGYYVTEKPPATFAQYALSGRHGGDGGVDGQRLNLRLIGHDPLWGHLLWHASRILAEYLEAHADELVRHKTVLELGAGAGLPSLVCAILGAERVVVTDYPDRDLIENLRFNIDHALDGTIAADADADADTDAGFLTNVVAEGYLWGNQTDGLVAALDRIPSSSSAAAEAQSSTKDTVDANANVNTKSRPEPKPAFNLLILADLIFNHSEHRKLLQTISQTLLKPDQPPAPPPYSATATPPTSSPSSASTPPTALVFFTPHRPHLYDRDMAFFDLAATEMGFVVRLVVVRMMEVGMFDAQQEQEQKEQKEQEAEEGQEEAEAAEVLLVDKAGNGSKGARQGGKVPAAANADYDKSWRGGGDDVGGGAVMERLNHRYTEDEIKRMVFGYEIRWA